MADVHMDIGNLDESQQLALGTYTSVTNQEPTQAIPLLQRSEWNVQVCHTKLAASPRITAVINVSADCHSQIL